MAAAGGPNYTNALKEADARTGVGPLNIPCERCGGESRRQLLKRKAHDITRSTAEMFAYCTSRTTSIIDSADLISSFCNVIACNLTFGLSLVNIMITLSPMTGMTLSRTDFAQVKFNLGPYLQCPKPSCKGCSQV